MALNNNDNIMLITPEQYSLVAERRLLKTLGESKMACVENSGFSRISNEVKRKYGGDNLPILTKGGKAIIMTQAIDAVSSSLTLFTKKLDTLDFVNSMVKIYDEMRSCNLSSSEITELSKSIEQDVLFKKMSDIALIMQKYEQLIENRFYDSADELTRLYNKIKDIGYFKGKKVFIDGFNGFVAQEYKILELVISEADEVTITLCTDSFEDEKQYDLFKYVNNSAHILEKIAKKANIEIKYTQLTENRRTDSDELIAVEKQFSNSDEKTIKGDVQNVTLYATKSISDECSQTARQIRKLLRNGCKASDITVITRDINKYRDELSCAFKKYEIPYFNDERQPVKTQPLVLFITYLLRCVNFSLKSDDILSLIKTDLTPIEL
ncbi:MAG: hypothetical protein LIO62_00825, partial [Clostridiales bacterium]|nr:hypothetical protein [Clostridiales bacterium]